MTNKHCNEAALLRVKEQILREPERLGMRSFEYACGTTRCIAGWALHLDGQTVNGMGSILPRAVAVVGLPPDAALELFGIGDGTLPAVMRANAFEAAQAIDNVIATGWPKWDEVLA